MVIGTSPSGIRIILFFRGGVCNRKNSSIADPTLPWVRVIVHRFNDDGIEGIQWGLRSALPERTALRMYFSESLAGRHVRPYAMRVQADKVPHT